jgi:hypothetical protein
MNRGLAYQEVFPDHADRERFLELLGECHETWGVQGPQDNRTRVRRPLHVARQPRAGGTRHVRWRCSYPSTSPHMSHEQP